MSDYCVCGIKSSFRCVCGATPCETHKLSVQPFTLGARFEPENPTVRLVASAWADLPEVTCAECYLHNSSTAARRVAAADHTDDELARVLLENELWHARDDIIPKTAFGKTVMNQRDPTRRWERGPVDTAGLLLAESGHRPPRHDVYVHTTTRTQPTTLFGRPKKGPARVAETFSPVTGVQAWAFTGKDSDGPPATVLIGTLGAVKSVDGYASERMSKHASAPTNDGFCFVDAAAADAFRHTLSSAPPAGRSPSLGNQYSQAAVAIAKMLTPQT